MDDGKLNVCRIYANTIADYLKLAVSMLRGDQKHNWNILCVEALQEVEIRCREKLPVQGDGDVIGHLPVTVKILPESHPDCDADQSRNARWKLTLASCPASN